MTGYIEIKEIPKACLDVGNRDNDCPFKASCPRYAQLYADNETKFENWVDMVCEDKPQGCPIKTKREVIRSWIGRKH